MRSFLVTILLILVPLIPSWAGQGDYTGEILFKDGTKTAYSRLRVLASESKEDILPYSKDLKDMKGATANLSKLQLAGISSMDFIGFTASEKTTMKSANIPTGIRKAKITFRDGAVYDDIYVDCSHGNWGSERESGWLGSDKIEGITVKLKKAKLCPKCSRQFKEVGWKYCPFCGMALK